MDTLLNGAVNWHGELNNIRGRHDRARLAKEDKGLLSIYKAVARVTQYDNKFRKDLLDDIDGIFTSPETKEFMDKNSLSHEDMENILFIVKHLLRPGNAESVLLAIQFYGFHRAVPPIP